MRRVAVLAALLGLTACASAVAPVLTAAVGSSGDADIILPALAVVATPTPPPPEPPPPPAPAVSTISVGGTYSDCSGATPLASRTVIYRDTCPPGIYLLAHNPGAGATFFGYAVGTRLSYAGKVYTVSSVASMSPAQAWNQAFANPPVLALQTCANESGSIVLVVRAS